MAVSFSRGLGACGLVFVVGLLTLAAPAQAGRITLWEARVGGLLQYEEEAPQSNRVTMRATESDGAVRHVRIDDADATIFTSESPPDFTPCFVSLDGHRADCVSLPPAANVVAVEAMFTASRTASFVVADGSAPVWLIVLRASYISTGTQTRVTLHGTSGADRFEIGPTTGSSAGDVRTGGGDDVVNARNGSYEQIDCGDGADQVTADPSDSLSGCETAAP